MDRFTETRPTLTPADLRADLPLCGNCFEPTEPDQLAFLPDWNFNACLACALEAAAVDAKAAALDADTGCTGREMAEKRAPGSAATASGLEWRTGEVA